MYLYNLYGTEVVERLCDMNGWLLIEILFESIVKGITKQLLCGIWATSYLLFVSE